MSLTSRTLFGLRGFARLSLSVCLSLCFYISISLFLYLSLFLSQFLFLFFSLSFKFSLFIFLSQFHYKSIFSRNIVPAFQEVYLLRDPLAGGTRCAYLELAEEEFRWTTMWSGGHVHKVLQSFPIIKVNVQQEWKQPKKQQLTPGLDFLGGNFLEWNRAEKKITSKAG
jgi:hypothetical protein